MKLLVGLGNPGREHLVNRHNLGFLAVESFVLSHGEDFRKEEFRARTARVRLDGGDVLVMMPQTYYNSAGDAVNAAMQFHKISMEDVIVVHDELDIPPLTFRMKFGGGAGGNNGVRSIMQHGDNFWRFRMGIGRPPHPGMDPADYVLGNLTKEDLDFWQKEMDKVHEAIEMCIAGKAGIAMNRFNRKDK